MLFETCYAGYEASDVRPSIVFKDLAKKQSLVVEKLLRNQVVGSERWVGVEVLRVGGGNGVAVVVGGKGEEGGKGSTLGM